MALAAGILNVTVEFANNLKDKEWFGKQDPYAVIQIGNQRFRTKTATDGGKNPVWNQSFQFQIINENDMSITLYDEDVVTSDDIIGKANVSLAGARQRMSDRQQVQLYTKSGKQQGIVSLSFTFSPSGQPAYGAPPPGAYPPPAAYPPPGGHAPPPASYPPAPVAYPPQPGYPPAPGGHAPAPAGLMCPPPGQAYPPPAQGYPPPAQGYPPAAGYPPPAAYPSAGHQPGYPPPAHGAPHAAHYPAPQVVYAPGPYPQAHVVHGGAAYGHHGHGGHKKKKYKHKHKGKGWPKFKKGKFKW